MPSKFSEWFAKRLRDAMGTMPQVELVNLLKENGFEIQQQRLSHYMTGRNYPDPPVMKEIARALGISADWWLGLTENSSPVNELEEELAQAKGEGRINKLMRNLSPDEQQQIIAFAEFVATRQRSATGRVNGSGGDLLSEEEQIAHRAAQLLDSIERGRGLEKREEIEQIFRDKHLPVNRAT